MATGLLSSLGPRELRVSDALQPVIVFTDGSWERGKSGIGALVWDPVSGANEVSWGEVPQGVLGRWTKMVGSQLICEIELYALLLIRSRYRRLFLHRRVICFVDNDPTRLAVIKGRSPSQAMNEMVDLFFKVELESPSYIWIERVPSFSNPADAPSRGCPHETAELWRSSLVGSLVLEADLLNLLAGSVSSAGGGTSGRTEASTVTSLFQ